jgi:hypothetical protein
VIKGYIRHNMTIQVNKASTPSAQVLYCNKVLLKIHWNNELIKEMRKLYTCMYNKKKRLEVSKNYMHVFGRYMDMFVCTIFIFHLFLMHFIL